MLSPVFHAIELDALQGIIFFARAEAASPTH
jgi:hypothetical protein